MPQRYGRSVVVCHTDGLGGPRSKACRRDAAADPWIPTYQLCWSEASYGVRCDGASQGGFLLKASPGRVSCISFFEPLVAEVQAAIETLALKQALLWGGKRLRWVHSQAQPADVRTKTSNGLIGRMLRFLANGRWRPVDDPMCTSA